MTFRGSLLAVVLAAAVPACAVAAENDADAGGPCGGGYSDTVDVRGLVTTAKTFSLNDLRALPQATLDVAYYSGSSGLNSLTYTGVPLYALLNELGIVLNPDQKNDILRKSIVITASDCYQVVVSMGEILPTFGGQPVLVAWGDGAGNPLSQDEGMARLVVPGDVAGGRYVSNIKRIVVRNPGPAPQAR